MNEPVLLLPEIDKPAVLSAEEFTNIRDSYLQWSQIDMMKIGGKEGYTLFVDLASTIEKLKDLPENVCLHIFSSQSAKQKLFGVLKKLQQTYPEYLPLIELEGELHVLFAQSADLFLRTSGGNTLNEFSHRLFGSGTFAEVEQAYRYAAALFGKCCLLFIKNGEDFPMVMHGVMYDQWMTNYLKALTRYLLARLSQDLLVRSPQTKIAIASADEILPHLITHPGMRNCLRERELELVYTSSLEFFFINAINQLATGYTVFTNLGILALILGDVPYARKSLRLAKEFANGTTIPQIIRLERLIDIFEPSISA